MKNSIVGLILILAGATLCQPEAAFGQNEKTLAQTNPPKLIRYTKPARKKSANSATSKRKKKNTRRKIDLSKVPRVIRVMK